MRTLSAGDIVRTVMHQGSRRGDCEVVRVTATGKVVVRDRNRRIMRLQPYQVRLIKSRYPS